jgi:hypothetical protein
MQILHGRPMPYLQVIWYYPSGILSTFVGSGKLANSRPINIKGSNGYKKRT